MFNAKKTKEDLVVWMRDWFERNGKDCLGVVGISGGKDSSVIAALLVEALGKKRVFGVMMPNGTQKDIQDSIDLCKFLDIRNTTIDISHSVNGVISEMKSCDSFPFISEQTMINLPARIRMTTLYAISQTLGGRVLNTCNLSEDYVGYATRYGDAAGDVSPLANLTVGEVIAIGKELGLPDQFTFKTPSDGLCGKSDEDNLGFTYAVLDEYIRTGVCKDVEVKKKIDYLNQKNKFKLELMETFPLTK